MKKRILIGAVIIAAAALLIIGLGSCSLITPSSTPSGKVIEGRTGEGIAGLTVMLSYVEQSSLDEDKNKELEKENDKITSQGEAGVFKAYTSEGGVFDWANNETETSVPYGEFLLTASDPNTGYIFIKQKVNLNSAYPEFTIVGLEGNPESDDISLVLMWNESFADVDGHLTIPASTQGGSYEANFPTPFDPYSAEGVTAPAGFAPETSATSSYYANSYAGDRVRIHHAYEYSTNSATTYDSYSNDTAATYDTHFAKLDIDDRDGNGPETITISGNWFSFFDGDTPATGNTTVADYLPGFDHTTNYQWDGVLEYYVYAFASDSDGATADTSFLSQADSGQSADAVLYVFQGDSMLGAYTVPTFTDLKAASLLRINCLWEYIAAEADWFPFFYIVPDVKLSVYDIYPTTSNTFGSGFRGMTDDGVIVTRGRRPRS